MSLFDQIKIINEKIQTSLDSCNRKDLITLVAATKKQNINLIESCIRHGITHIGENRVQEAENKLVPLKHKNIGFTKRMIGHLQSNKINKALTLFNTIDSIDSISLGKKIALKTKKNNQNIETLIEINTSGEENKFGFKLEDDQSILECIEIKNLNVRGLMTIGPNTKDIKKTQNAFKSLRKTKENLNRQLPANKQLAELSMGMSGDYDIAIKEGSTMIRLGTALFGKRE